MQQHTGNTGVLSPSIAPEGLLYQEEPEDPMTSKELSEAKIVSKCVRILTVMAYILSVSMAAILLSLYYVFLWDPAPSSPPEEPEPPNALRAPDYNALYAPMMMVKVNETGEYDKHKLCTRTFYYYFCRLFASVSFVAIFI